LQSPYRIIGFQEANEMLPNSCEDPLHVSLQVNPISKQRAKRVKLMARNISIKKITYVHLWDFVQKGEILYSGKFHL